MVKVLFVEDDIYLSKRVYFELGRFHYQVDVCCNGKEAIRRYKLFNPDIIFLDLVMPIMDGETALLELRKINKTIKIVMMSGVKGGVDNILFNLQVLSLKEKGANGFLLKPFGIGGLFSKINELVQ